MRLSLHILYALTALATVTAAASMGSQQGLRMVRPGGDFDCRSRLPDHYCDVSVQGTLR